METRRSWSGYVGVALIPAGIAVVILNYTGLMPGGNSNSWLYLGLLAVLVGIGVLLGMALRRR